MASAHPLATAAGLEILNAGGNAFDAAVAVAATLGVVEPGSSGLGGGGFWLLRRADGTSVVIDARERAPLHATANLYLDRAGNVIPRASLDGPLAAAIPGEPAALAYISRHYGRLPLARALAPAIRHAENGFAVSAHYQRAVQTRHDVLMHSAGAAAIFLDDDFVPEPGFILKQTDLADTLRLLARTGGRGFYRGAFAQKLVAGVRDAGGIWTEEDLARYRIVERKPLKGKFRGVEILTAPPPGGGAVMLEALNILAPLHAADAASRIRDIVEAWRLAYRDRAQVMGDPAFTPIDLKRLLSASYAAKLREEMRTHVSASPSAAIGAGHTTHFSIVDRAGNVASVTLSINGPFGSAYVVPGTGVLLNNEMDDFVAKPGVPNLYGLVGAQANAIAPGKRPLSSMTPTVLDDGRRLIAIGTPGGSRIISMVMLATLAVAERRGNVSDWVALPRFHHQYLPDTIEYEPQALAPRVRSALVGRGYRLKEIGGGYGNMQAVMWDRTNGELSAASDPRGEGAATVMR